MSYQRHNFHLVDPSPWPFIGGFSAYTLFNGAVFYFHGALNGKSFLNWGLLFIIIVMYFWWTDVIAEATFKGDHTKIVQNGLKLGVILFIVSEIMFFFAFFWAFFASSLTPTIDIGAIWPPAEINVFNTWDVPFINTLILLSSGVTITWSHHALVSGNKNESNRALKYTIIFALIFTIMQYFEYAEATFNISDGIYGSTFYLATGFHGFHVIIGTIFLTVCLFRIRKNHFTTKHHLGFEAAAWYWHFVDVVWLFLFLSIYWWGSL